MLYEQNKMIETIINNSIITNNIEMNKLSIKLSQIFKEIQDIIIANPNNIEKIQNTIIDNFWNKINIIINNTPGITIGIKDNITKNELYIYHGKTSDNYDAPFIDENTLFDLASVTKLFTATRLLKEQEQGNINLNNNLNYYLPEYKNINVSLIDISKFYYQINTNGRLDTATNYKELITRLYNSYIANENTNIYSDIPYILLGETLHAINSSFKKIFNQELKMTNTTYNPINSIITGSTKDNYNQIHDPKARIMTYYGFKELGHAGLYSTSQDLIKLSSNLLPNSNFLTNESLKILRTPSKNKYQFYNNKTNTISNKNRAMGVYIQTNKGIHESDIAIESSKETLAAAGKTGSYILIDPTNNYTFNYLTNPYSQEKGCPIITINNNQQHWAEITNILKEELMNLVYELRYTSNIFDTLAQIQNQEQIKLTTNKLIKSPKIIKR